MKIKKYICNVCQIKKFFCEAIKKHMKLKHKYESGRIYKVGCIVCENNEDHVKVCQMHSIFIFLALQAVSQLSAVRQQSVSFDKYIFTHLIENIQIKTYNKDKVLNNKI